MSSDSSGNDPSGGTDEQGTKFGSESDAGGCNWAGDAGGCSNVGIEVVQGGVARPPEAEFEDTQCARTSNASVFVGAHFSLQVLICPHLVD